MAEGVVYLSLIERGSGEVELRYWRNNPNQLKSRRLGIQEIDDLVRKAESDYYAISEPDLVAVGQRLHRWIDGEDRWLARLLGEVGHAKIALMIEAAGRLGHLPWEVMHDGTTFLVRGANPAVLPVRWQPREGDSPAPKNRALHVLYMATSPIGVQPELNFEEEEGRILRATESYPLGLTVEETGTLNELKSLVDGYEEGYFDVLHLTGHADHREEGPRFLVESEMGDPDWVSADQIAAAIERRPAIVFLSGCRTGQSPGAGAVPSLAEGLLAQGFTSVLGWGRPVFDADAIVAAAALYDHLSKGYTPVQAVLQAHAKLWEAHAKHWHLLRLFVAGPSPAAPVTAPKAEGRKKPPPRTHARRWQGRKQNVTGGVVDRADFVGRRRPLQRFIRALRGNTHPAGVVVHGMGGVGKSAIACRICDRLDDAFEVIVHEGVLDEPGFLNSMEQLNAITPEQRMALQGDRQPLRFRLRAFLDQRADAGRKPMLIVLDDFEQNMPEVDGRPTITPRAQEVVEALAWAIDQGNGTARCLITSRYALATSQAAKFYQEQLAAMRPAEVAKKRRTLHAYREAPPEVSQLADRLADGNPRLMERLNLALASGQLDTAALFARMEAVEAEFREEILDRALLDALPFPTRQLLATLLVYQLPVPLPAVTALIPDWPESDVNAALDSASALGLIEAESQPNGTFLYRVPRIFQPLLDTHRPANSSIALDAAATSLFHLWWQSNYPATEAEALEVIRLGFLAGRSDLIVPVAIKIGRDWIRSNRYREALPFYRKAVESVGHDYRLIGGLGIAELQLGDGDTGYALLHEALDHCPADDAWERLYLTHEHSTLLIQRGLLDQALGILRDQQLPAADRLGDKHARAVTLGLIADIFHARGDSVEAMRIRHEEELPVYERLGDVRSRAITMGKIADILQGRGDTDEAMRIRREEELPVYERLGDMRVWATAMSKIADILLAQGNTDEALRIRREELLPVYERLGDLREWAITTGRIASILQAQGNIDEALRIRREEQLPVYDRIDDVRSRAIAMGKIADILLARGDTEEALRIRCEEELPVYERLGYVRSRAITLDKIADNLLARGDTEEALRIRRDEQLPVYERLGDVRSRAIILGKIADILLVRGGTDEALRLLRDECLPIFRKLQELQSLIQVLLRIGRLQLRAGAVQEARKYLLEAKRLAGHHGDTETLNLLRTSPWLGDLPSDHSGGHDDE